MEDRAALRYERCPLISCLEGRIVRQSHPTLNLIPGRDHRAKRGAPWIFSNEIDMSPEAKALPPGALVTLRLANKEALGTAFFNSHSLIAARLLSARPDEPIGREWLEERLARALRLRERLTGQPFYRLVHAEGDGLPGLVIDRFGDTLVLEIGAAGMERMREDLLAALDTLLAPRNVILKNEAAVRTLEGLPRETTLAKGEDPGTIDVIENDIRYRARPMTGQKTGWFFDQRENRARVAALSKDRSVLDVYCHTGGFGLAAISAGAQALLAIDGSADALALAAEAAEVNGWTDKVTLKKGDAFQEMERLINLQSRFGVVVCDPPAFAKTRKDAESGAKGYRKLARLAAQLVDAEGILFMASCSHHVDPVRFAVEVAAGIASAGRQARILGQYGAGPDHPVHPLLPETAYLKGVLLQLD